MRTWSSSSYKDNSVEHEEEMSSCCMQQTSPWMTAAAKGRIIRAGLWEVRWARIAQTKRERNKRNRSSSLHPPSSSSSSSPCLQEREFEEDTVKRKRERKKALVHKTKKFSVFSRCCCFFLRDFVFLLRAVLSFLLLLRIKFLLWLAARSYSSN